MILAKKQEKTSPFLHCLVDLLKTKKTNKITKKNILVHKIISENIKALNTWHIPTKAQNTTPLDRGWR